MRYQVRAVRGKDQLGAWAVEAPDAGAAAQAAFDQGWRVLSVRPAVGRPWARLRQPAFPVQQFSQELRALLEAGLSLVESLEALAEKERQPEVRATLAKINAVLQEGRPLSQALEATAGTFPPLYVATVRASEHTGGLGEALGRYVAYQAQMDAVRRQVVSASIYPLLLAGVGGLVTVFLLGYVVPRFSHLYGEVGGNLPWMARVLMQWGRLVEAHGLALLLALLLVVAAAAHGLARPASRRWLMQGLARLPGAGERLRAFQLARFYRTLGMLLRGGMPVVPSLGMAADLLGAGLREQLVTAGLAIREGQPLSQAMERNGLTTAVAFRMLRVGERTGRLGEMMERVAAFHEEETARWVDRFTRLFEPVLMAIIGLVIGGIVVLMYFPIFELAGSLQ